MLNLAIPNSGIIATLGQLGQIMRLMCRSCLVYEEKKVEYLYQYPAGTIMHVPKPEPERNCTLQSADKGTCCWAAR